MQNARTHQVEFDQSMIRPEALVSAVEDMGFDARLLEVTQPHRSATGSGANANGSGGRAAAPQVVRLAVGGMTCAACSGGVERALAAVPGVQRVGVALTEGEAEVRVRGCGAAVGLHWGDVPVDP